VLLRGEKWRRGKRGDGRMFEIGRHVRNSFEQIPVLRQRSSYPRFSADPGAHWFARAEGLDQYLQIFPDGSEADDAWWNATLRHVKLRMAYRLAAKGNGFRRGILRWW
jgi:hypothetical protein